MPKANVIDHCEEAILEALQLGNASRSEQIRVRRRVEDDVQAVMTVAFIVLIKEGRRVVLQVNHMLLTHRQRPSTGFLLSVDPLRGQQATQSTYFQGYCAWCRGWGHKQANFFSCCTQSASSTSR